MQRVKRKTRDGVFAYRKGGGLHWGVDYRDPATKKRRRKTGFASKELALRWKDREERRLLGLLKKEEEVEQVLFKDAVDRYLEHRFAAGKSVRSYSHLRVIGVREQRPGFWTKVFGDHPITSLTADMIEEALRKRARRYRWAPATYNRALAQISALFTYARRRKWIKEHPVERGRIPRMPEDNARTRWLRLHEIEAILEKTVGPGGVVARVRADMDWTESETTEEIYDRVIGINLRGPYFLTQAAARWMIELRKADPNMGAISAALWWGRYVASCPNEHGALHFAGAWGHMINVDELSPVEAKAILDQMRLQGAYLQAKPGYLDSHISRIDLIGKDAIKLRDGRQVTEFQEGILPWALRHLNRDALWLSIPFAAASLLTAASNRPLAEAASA